MTSEFYDPRKDGNITLDVSFGMTIQKSPGSYEYDRIDFAIRGVPVNATPEYLQQVIAQARPTQDFIWNALIDKADQILKEGYGR